MGNRIYDRTILIIDDEIELLSLLETVLSKEGFKNVYCAKTGTEGLQLFSQINIDLVVLDISLPDYDGYEICKKIREKSKCPILFLSSKIDEIDKILGFALGADDYITKPFSPKEVYYRIVANLNRYHNIPDNNEKVDILEQGIFYYNLETMQVFKNKKELKLNPKELKLFEVFLRHPNMILSKNKLVRLVWNDEFYGYENTIMVHIRKLREKVEDHPSNPEYIQTVKGLGYRFRP